MRPFRQLREAEDGAVAVEFALWTVGFFLVIAVALDFGFYFMQRSQMDESLSATAVSAFSSRDNVAFASLPDYARALSGDGAMTVALSCNGVSQSCTNLERSCSCLNADASYTVQECGSVCTASGTSAGYYLTIDATSQFGTVIVPDRLLGDGQISRSMTMRLE